MSTTIEELYTDTWSDIDSDSDKLSVFSYGDSDSESDTQQPSDSDEDEVHSKEETEWLENDVKPEFHEFMGQPGIQINSVDLNSIKSVVDVVIAENLIELLVRESNRYHRDDSTGASSNKSKEWTDITVTEMKQFLALIILMGFVRKSDRDDYWSTDPLLCTPIFGNTLTRNRFNQIWKYWHFNDNQLCRNRLDKIKPVLEYFTKKVQTIYKPQRELCVDEYIIPWRGKLSFETRDSTRMTKRGILVRTVCEADSGYICNLEFHCTREETLKTTMLTILDPFLNMWHSVYTNCYYNSVTIAEELLKQRTGVCGVVRKNRGVPDSLKSINFKENGRVFCRKNNTLVQTCRTNKSPVYIISTIHSAGMNGTVNRRRMDRISKPACVIDYNKYMRNMDRADQYLSYYSILRKTKKWSKRAVLYLFNCSLFNAYKIYAKASGNNMKYKKFLLAVARTWLDSTQETGDFYSDDERPSTSTKKAPKLDPTGRLCSDMKKHRIVRINGQGNIKNPRRACRVCTAAKKRSSTAFMCSSCNVPLHVGKCFENYHTLTKY